MGWGSEWSAYLRKVLFSCHSSIQSECEEFRLRRQDVPQRVCTCSASGVDPCNRQRIRCPGLEHIDRASPSNIILCFFVYLKLMERRSTVWIWAASGWAATCSAMC